MDGLTISQVASASNVNVETVACSKCEVIIYNLNERMVAADNEEKAKAYGIESYPSVTVNGKIVDIEKLSKVNLAYH